MTPSLVQFIAEVRAFMIQLFPNRELENKPLLSIELKKHFFGGNGV
jgi:hypothetical protein